MQGNILVLLCTFILVDSQSDAERIVYYTQLINNASIQSLNYQLPTNNNQFVNGGTDNNIYDYGSFDFIIVGAGSAGAVIAKRLSEKRWSVLLLEAGDEDSDITEIPALFPLLQFSKYNWGYYTKPQESCCQAMINHQCNFPRGKVLGGSSSINAMLYARGNQMDQNLWYMHGNTGWSFNDTLPYFKKYENYQLDVEKKYHGFTGPISVDYVQPNNILVEKFVQANVDMGKQRLDYNGRIQMGTSRTQYTIRGGRRDSTAKGYLRQRNRYLNVTTNAYVYKVNFNFLNWATGVTFIRNGIRYTARAKREVILSGGTINTPQILLLSGIGPAEDLQALNIPLIRNLPVGKSLEDHIMFIGIRFRSNIKNVFKNLTGNVKDFLGGVGYLTDPNLSGLGYLQTKPNIYKDYPNVEMFLVASMRNLVPYGNVYNLNADARTAYKFSDDEIDNIFTITLVLLHPKSKGTVTLTSSDPFDFPTIDTRSLSEEEDVEAIYNATQYVLSLLDTETYREINATLVNTTLAACSDFEYLSRDYWYCQIRQMSHTVYHPTGTCKMGALYDQTSVVDSRLNVRGFKRLRIADASVIPLSPSGHTNGPAIMIGERASDIILAENLLPSL